MRNRSDCRRGNFAFDRRIPGVGRLRVTSGTTNARLFWEYNRLITHLVGLTPSRVDIIEAIREKRISLATVLEAAKCHRLHTLELPPVAEIDLETSWALWAETTPNARAGAARRRVYRAVSEYLPRRSPSWRDLPAALRACQVATGPRRRPAMFNRVRAAVLAYLRDHVGVNHEAYTAATLVRPSRVVRLMRPAPSPEQAILIREALAPPHAAIWWAMYCTGMRPGELWGEWTLEGDNLHLPSGRLGETARVIPLIEAVARPTVHRRAYATQFRKVVGRDCGIRPLDARRGFLDLLVFSGVPSERVARYMGYAVDWRYIRSHASTVSARHLDRDVSAMRALVAAAEAKVGSCAARELAPAGEMRGAPRARVIT